jgi:hypothetical protein
MAKHREYYKEEGGGSLEIWTVLSFNTVFARGSSMHQKCFNYALTNLLLGLCRSVWIVDPLVIHLNPHLEALACPSTPEVLNTPIPYPFTIFFTLDS